MPVTVTRKPEPQGQRLGSESRVTVLAGALTVAALSTASLAVPGWPGHGVLPAIRNEPEAPSGPGRVASGPGRTHPCRPRQLRLVNVAPRNKSSESLAILTRRSMNHQCAGAASDTVTDSRHRLRVQVPGRAGEPSVWPEPFTAKCGSPGRSQGGGSIFQYTDAWRRLPCAGCADSLQLSR